MTSEKGATWTIGPPDGELLLHTGVAGRAARMGHRLTIVMSRWRATVNWAGSRPVSAELAVDVGSFAVVNAEGGIKGLSATEKAQVRSNALKSLDAKRFPEIRYSADVIERAGDGYRLTGALEIHGTSRDHVVDVRTEDLGNAWRISGETAVRQTDYGVKPYSLLMGSVQVADEVSLTFTAVHAKDG
ncbi:YceI family protein [Mycobacterium intracellulare]|uniref:YceI family protein n=2 Tax=Mycobacterium intracellulare subsp. chimaera TaxID=222805 RepID=A0ABT7P3G4_MYCIT|nr:YceI family protein [Mycobacterium intracellulare]ASQ86550.1 S-adenosyl-L-methionine-dependent methyltransferase [Mycobacterium intracellulare subsp. chimaera]MCF1814106.1 YceI family protein [Mycobacterium intracellulare subsp. intracellulare]MDM3927720.1 YceI family protein [Mycobacterium intracellulare subsp. chimaera]MDS0335813.1 YceI family protein [Mycobacterium intracellulare]